MGMVKVLLSLIVFMKMYEAPTQVEVRFLSSASPSPLAFLLPSSSAILSPLLPPSSRVPR